MDQFTPLAGLLGGVMIGAAAGLLLLAIGEVAGVSGVLARGLRAEFGADRWRAAFLIGLPLGAFVMGALGLADAPQGLSGDYIWLIAGGLITGLGARIGGGCTSGHGVCGLARFSKRSAVAVAVFFAAAIVTVYVVRHGI